MMDLIAHGAHGHRHVHFLMISVAEIGFVSDGAQEGWIRSELFPLWMLSGPVQHFQSAIFEGLQLGDKGFRALSFWDVRGSHQLSVSSHLWESQNGIEIHVDWWTVEWFFFWEQAWRWSSFERLYLFFPVVHVRDRPKFLPLWARDRRKWPRCLLWHGWLPGLRREAGRSPWAVSLGDTVSRVVAASPADVSPQWAPPDGWDADDLALEIDDHPCVWTAG